MDRNGTWRLSTDLAKERPAMAVRRTVIAVTRPGTSMTNRQAQRTTHTAAWWTWSRSVRFGWVALLGDCPRMRHFLALAITTAVTGLATACSSDSVGPPPAPPVNWQSLDAKPRLDAGGAGPTANERRVAETYAAALGGGANGGDDGGTTGTDRIAGLGGHLDGDVRLTFPGWQDVHGR